jgi:Spy/CpxP family protein refolding chaperone
MKRIFCLAIVCGALAGTGASVSAQAGRAAARGGALGEDAPVSPAEIQRMFDSYALMQAQEQLQIGDEVFPQFLRRFKLLQDVRRRTLQERVQVIQQLRRLVNDPQADEAQIKERLKALDEVEARSDAEIRKAYDAINQVLDVRQQAKFRVFEENMERRKLELVTRARQANRKQQQQQKPQ